MRQIALLRMGLLVFAALLVSSLSAHYAIGATNHIVRFGGVYGYAYSPKTLPVAVKDTITWVGDFSFHPLGSLTIPAGAIPFANSSGTDFQYVVSVAGTYNYECQNHGVTDGMVGSFTASVTGVKEEVPSGKAISFRLDQNYPNPFNPSTVITYSLPSRASVSLMVYNALGGRVAELSNGLQDAGSHQITFDGSGLSSGVYFYRLQARESPQSPAGGDGKLFTATRTLLLLK